ncbi:MAG: GTP-binding protein [Candidatus Helarchaeota archaeon]|nr:GTP-binding protein [Candidatus Helarchaeota archaeon]
MEPTHRFKIILYGNSAVGKTSIVNRYVNNKFEDDYISTLGYNVLEKIIELGKDKISFLIFDIGGQEKFTELRKQYSKGANAALIMYDITDRDSFNNVRNWYNDLIEFTDNARFILIANKIDLEDQRQVSTQEGEELAKEIFAEGFFETSAKENIEVDNTFLTFAKILIS